MEFLAAAPEFQGFRPRQDERDELAKISGQMLEFVAENAASGGRNDLRKSNKLLQKASESSKINGLPVLSQPDEP